MTLFHRDNVVGAFRGFSEGGMEFHADLVLPYRSEFQSTAMHGQFVLVALENDNEAVLGRITTIAAQGRLTSPSGEDYAVRAVREERPIPEDLRDQYLRYRVDIRILGLLRQEGDKVLFVSSHRRLPHVGAKVAFLSDALLCEVAGSKGVLGAQIGFLALGEFIYAGDDPRVGREDWMVLRTPEVLPRFDVNQLVSRRTFVFARAGFGKSNLIKLLFSNLYGTKSGPTAAKRKGREVPVGTVVFDPDGEYFWPDDKGRPGLCDVDSLVDSLVVFTDREAPSPMYQSFVVGQVKLDIRELAPAKVLGIVLPPERQEQQNVAKLKQLSSSNWRTLVDSVWRDRGGTEPHVFYDLLKLKSDGTQDAEMLAARANMVRVVSSLHDPSSQLLGALLAALGEGKLCVVDISRMRGAQGLALAGVLLQHIFEHNQDEFTKAEPRTIPTIAVIEEAQAVLGGTTRSVDDPFVAWVKEGRKYDLGAVLVTQQPGSLGSELLSQGDNWFIFHLLSAVDLQALKRANAHFSDDLLSSLLNEPIVGNGVFWSSAGGRAYPVPIRALSFNDAHTALDPDYDQPLLRNYAHSLRERFKAALTTAADSLGHAESVGGTLDAAETLRAAAIEALRRSEDFQARVRSAQGIPWRGVQEILANAAPTGIIADPKQWAYALVAPALNDVLGQRGWRTDKRPRANDPTALTTWVVATNSALPGSDDSESEIADPGDVGAEPSDSTDIQSNDDHLPF
jgi:hypothetical protein